ncbi:MAG: hypothetical protein Q9199_002436 [Rusavskia elegans]
MCADLLVDKKLQNNVQSKSIEKETRRKDFENLTSCCKTIFALANLNIKRKFSTFIVDDLHLYNGIEEPVVPRELHPVLALRELLADKDAAVNYCQTLRIGGVTQAGYVTGQYEDDVTGEASLITRELEPQLKALTDKGPFADSDEWIERQLEGVYDL